jgi:putative ABC transport system substrate-binding protein
MWYLGLNLRRPETSGEDYMKRRDFITLLGGAAASWPFATRAQQADRVRRIAVLNAFGENDPEPKRWLSGFLQGLQELGWTNGRNLRMDVRWTASNVDLMPIFAKELIDLQPDVILTNSTPLTAILQRETQTIPIVFVAVADPVGNGFVTSLPRPGGNITGFISQEAPIAGKWLELLTEIAPGVTRAAIMFNPDTAPGGVSYYLSAFEAAARPLKVASIAAPIHNDAEIETVITSLGREPRGGLVVMPDAFMIVHRTSVISLAARNNVPAVYPHSLFLRDGGLISFGPDYADLYWRAASYVDRILRGTKPEGLPVEVPVKFEMTLNAKTARALGLAVPQSILLRADVIE